MGVAQSGPVTAGHGVAWLTDGVIGDAGATPASQRVLASLRGADFNTTNDQPISIPQQFVAFQLTGIVVTNPTVSLTSAIGGFYTQPLKGGSVLANQAYSPLMVPASLLQLTLLGPALITRFSASNLGLIAGLPNIWFSLTTPQGGPAFADIYLVGLDLT